MNAEPTLQIHKKDAVRNRLPHKVEQAEKTDARTVWLTIFIILLPFAIMWFWEIGARIVHPPERNLPRPWAALNMPYAPLSQYHWTGDLTRIARLPYFDRLLEIGPYPKRYAHRITDERGYVNKPAGRPPQIIGNEYEMILTGSSEMAEGSTVDMTFASQLESITGKKIYNASWPGGSVSQGILRLLTDAEFYQGQEQVVLWGMIQRYLYDWGFADVNAYLGEDGATVKPFAVGKPNLSVDDYLKWRLQIETYLETTSVVRTWATWPAHWLPPMALDKGFGSPVRISWLNTNGQAPILYYPDDINSTYVSFEERGGEMMLEAIRRVQKACAHKRLRLICLLVPDKYELLRDHTEPKLYPKRVWVGDPPQHPERRAPAVLAERLRENGVEVIDLYEPLYQAQFGENTDKLMYWVDDTHWSDDGIRVAAQATAKYLKTTSLRAR